MGTVVGAKKVAAEDAAGAETKTSSKKELERARRSRSARLRLA